MNNDSRLEGVQTVEDLERIIAMAKEKKKELKKKVRSTTVSLRLTLEGFEKTGLHKNPDAKACRDAIFAEFDNFQKAVEGHIRTLNAIPIEPGPKGKGDPAPAPAMKGDTELYG